MWTSPSYILRYKPVIYNPSLYRIQRELNCARVTGVVLKAPCRSVVARLDELMYSVGADGGKH